MKRLAFSAHFWAKQRFSSRTKRPLRVRPTYDVDAIAEISSYAAYADFSERLRRCGFSEDASEGAPICRWRLKKTILDVMSLDEKILGFSNRWYKPAMDSAVVHELEPDLHVRVVTAVYFCATKLEAFAGRGKHDYQSSHDLEDLMAVVDGRPELAEEIRSGPEDVRAYIGAEFRKLLATRSFSMHYPVTYSPTKPARLASRYCLSDCKR